MKKGTLNATWLYSPPERDQLSPLRTAKCQTCYQSLAECEVSQLFDVLNMKSDHRTKQLSATSTCQKQSTPIIIEFLSCMHLLCRHWGVLQYRSANKDFRQSENKHHKLHLSSSKGRWWLSANTVRDAPFCPERFQKRLNDLPASRNNAVLWPREYDFNFVKGSPH